MRLTKTYQKGNMMLTAIGTRRAFGTIFVAPDSDLQKLSAFGGGFFRSFKLFHSTTHFRPGTDQINFFF